MTSYICAMLQTLGGSGFVQEYPIEQYVLPSTRRIVRLAGLG